jgi:hypothetical protein
MKLTKDQIEQLRRNPLFGLLPLMYGVDVDKLVEEAEKEEATIKEAPQPVEDDRMDDIRSRIETLVKNLNNNSTVEKHTDGNKTIYHIKQNPPCTKPEEPKPDFVMSREQFIKFCNNYRQLVTANKKLNYLFGIDCTSEGCQFSIYGKIQEIIWDFVNIIFGEDNRNDIADFIFGESNFDTPGQLYDELT